MPSSAPTPRCPLCEGAATEPYQRLGPREYLRCRRCTLTFLRPDQRPCLAEERAEYDLHDNDPADPRYLRHLAQLTDPLTEGLAEGSRGLDFGSGPGPAISAMLGARGYEVVNYDPIYAPNPAPLQQHFDFIACTEVVEHLWNPARELRLLSSLLADHGRLGIMTELLCEHIDFSTWRYTREKSHVCFYAPSTMEFIAQELGLAVDVRPPRVTLMVRKR